MSKHQIARTLGIDRKSVDRHWAELRSKEATDDEAFAAKALTGSEVAKGANMYGTFLSNKLAPSKAIMSCPF